MITPIKTLGINQIVERREDLLVSVDDIKKMAKSERNKAIDEFAARLKEKCFDSSKNLNVYSSFREFVDEIASQMKGEKEC